MKFVILLILAGYLYYRHEKQKKAVTDEGEETRSYNTSNGRTNRADSYVDPIPYGLRRKNAIDAYLGSNHTSIKSESAKSNSSQAKEEVDDIQDDVSSDDLFVNTSTGEIKTSYDTFKPENQSDLDTVNEYVTPASAESQNDIPRDTAQAEEANSKGKKSMSSDSRKEGSTDSSWKEKNKNAMDDLLNGL